LITKLNICPCFIKTENAFTFLIPAYPDGPRKEASKRNKVILMQKFHGDLDTAPVFCM